MKITINNKIIKLLREYGITSDYIGSVLIVLHALHTKNYKLLDELDDENSDLLFLHIYKDLEIKFILEKTDENDNIHFKLTETGNVLLHNILKLSNDLSKKIENVPINTEWISEWINLWKDNRGIFYRNSKYSLGAPLKDIENKFISFFTYYEDVFKNVPKEDIPLIILEVTKSYIKNQKLAGFESARKSINFISKIEGHTKDTKTSDLAALCEEYLINYSEKHVKSISLEFNHFNSSIN